jgi:hypothetical protein
MDYHQNSNPIPCSPGAAGANKSAIEINSPHGPYVNDQGTLQ